MAGREIDTKGADVTVATSAGYVTIASTVGFYKKAFGTLSLPDYDSMEVQITEVVSATVLGIRRVRGPGEGQNYGRDDVSGFMPQDRLYFDALTAAFNAGAVVTGAGSGATADILEVVMLTATTGYLILDNIAGGPFDDNEALTDDGLVPGGATANGAEETQQARLDMPSQLIYNSNDLPLS